MYNDKVFLIGIFIKETVGKPENEIFNIQRKKINKNLSIKGFFRKQEIIK